MTVVRALWRVKDIDVGLMYAVLLTVRAINYIRNLFVFIFCNKGILLVKHLVNPTQIFPTSTSFKKQQAMMSKSHKRRQMKSYYAQNVYLTRHLNTTWLWKINIQWIVTIHLVSVTHLFTNYYESAVDISSVKITITT